MLYDYLKEQNIEIDLIISSHAVRAHQTAIIIGKGLNYPESKIQISTAVYHGDVDGLIQPLI